MSIDVIHRRCPFFFFLSPFKNVDFSFVLVFFFFQFSRCAWVYYSFQHWFRSFKVLRIISTASRGSSSQWKTINWDILLSLAMMPLNDEWLRDNFLLYIGCVVFFFSFILCSFFILLLWRAKQFVWPDIVARDTVTVFTNSTFWGEISIESKEKPKH